MDTRLGLLGFDTEVLSGSSRVSKPKDSITSNHCLSLCHDCTVESFRKNLGTSVSHTRVTTKKTGAGRVKKIVNTVQPC